MQDLESVKKNIDFVIKENELLTQLINLSVSNINKQITSLQTYYTNEMRTLKSEYMEEISSLKATYMEEISTLKVVPHDSEELSSLKAAHEATVEELTSLRVAYEATVDELSSLKAAHKTTAEELERMKSSQTHQMDEMIYNKGLHVSTIEAVTFDTKSVWVKILCRNA